ncbi:MAG: ABC transporter substrate-binding protein [Firmicutes bacterium]|nr:ABC transporter substrate-binding protein [Bacillota bacterium]
MKKTNLIPAVATVLSLTTVLGSSVAMASTTHHTSAPVQISFWYGIGGALSQDVQMLVSQFNKTHPGIHVTATYEGSYSGGGPEQQKLLAAIRAGDAPDLAQMEVHSMPVFALAGRLLSLTDYMKSSPHDKPSDFITGMLESTEFGGQYYGVPFNRSVPVVYYNETMFKKAGIANPPSTWQELMADAKKLTHGSGDSKVYGFEPLVDWWPFEASVWSGGGHIMSANRSQATFATSAGEQVLSMEQQLVKQGYAKVQTGPNYWTDTTESFAAGQTAMDIDSPGSAEEVVKAVGNKFDWNTAMFPADVTRAVPPGGADAVIMASTPVNLRPAAWTFIQWWTDPAQSARWSELTGYVPVAKGALNSPGFQAFVKAHPYMKAAIAELKYQHASPASAQYLTLLQYVQQGLQSAFDLGKPVSQAMQQTQQQVNSSLSN